MHYVSTTNSVFKATTKTSIKDDSKKWIKIPHNVECRYWPPFAECKGSRNSIKVQEAIKYDQK